MALKSLYALFDKAINCHMNPLVFNTDGEAIRWFTTIVNNPDPNNAIHRHYGDYSLYFLGVYDDAAGAVHNEKRKLIEGVNVKETERQYTLTELFDAFEKKA